MHPVVPSSGAENFIFRFGLDPPVTPSAAFGSADSDFSVHLKLTFKSDIIVE